MTTQTQALAEYLIAHGSITSREAEDELGIMRCASRIHDLKREGYRITDSWEKVPSRYGQTRVKRWHMGGRHD